MSAASKKLSKAVRVIELLQIIYGVLARCAAKLEEITAPGFDPDTISPKELRDELLALPDLPKK